MSTLPPSRPAGLSVSGLCLRLGGTELLTDITFTAPARAVTGLIGPNGAGKSTLLGALPGLHLAASLAGSVRFDGTDLAALRPRARARLVALVEQGAGAETRLSTREVVALGRIPHQSLWQVDETDADRQAIARALALCGLSHRAQQSYSSLSGGERQRAQIARALAQEPSLLILDEPTSHLDIRAQLLLMRLLRDLAAAGITVLAALHDLDLAARFCDHLVLLSRGRIAAEGAPATVLTAPRLAEVYGIEARISGTAPPRVELLGPKL